VNKVDFAIVRDRLYSDPQIAEKIVRDFGISGDHRNADEFAESLRVALDQITVDVPLEQRPGNRDVFRAAVRALGSNSRPWATFLKNEDALRDLLFDYDPAATCRVYPDLRDLAEKVKDCLPGQTASSDAKAVARWTRKLAVRGDYYGFVCDIGQAITEMATRQGEKLIGPELLLCLVGYLADPPTIWKGDEYVKESTRSLPVAERKLPGMRYALASEFLRNLGWSGFKPDRHIMRLFNLWYPDHRNGNSGRTELLESLIGRGNRDLSDYLHYSILGWSVTPDGMTLTQADGLIWLLGAYVERKGWESEVCYIMNGC